jgi:dihydrofolate reductase
MARLIYSMIASLDGYVADEDGNFDWAAPEEEVHAFVNDLERPIGTYLYGRRMYETMVYWETAPYVPSDTSLTTSPTRTPARSSVPSGSSMAALARLTIRLIRHGFSPW